MSAFDHIHASDCASRSMDDLFRGPCNCYADEDCTDPDCQICDGEPDAAIAAGPGWCGKPEPHGPHQVDEWNACGGVPGGHPARCPACGELHVHDMVDGSEGEPHA